MAEVVPHAPVDPTGNASVIAVASIDGSPSIAPAGALGDVDDLHAVRWEAHPAAGPATHEEAEPLPTLDVVVPVFNEVDCVTELFSRLDQLRTALLLRGTALRVIPVDDGSSDGSTEALEAVAQRSDWVQPVWLARNFGHQAAVTAGLDASTGTWCAVIDADLQDPPELLVAMLEQLQGDRVDVVYGQRQERRGESTFKLRTAHWFYRVMRRGSGLDIPLDAGDFRLMTAAVVSELRGMREHHRLLRAMVPWLGHRSAPHLYTRQERFAGSTKYPLRSMIKLASHAVFSFSTLPIRIVQALGLALCTAGSIGLTGLVVALLVDANPPLAAWVIGAMSLQTGLIVLSIGLIGGYVFRIQDEVKGRPLYVQRDRGTTS